MGLISGMMLGMIVGIALMAGWHRMMQHRTHKRTSKVIVSSTRSFLNFTEIQFF